MRRCWGWSGAVEGGFSPAFPETLNVLCVGPAPTFDKAARVETDKSGRDGREVGKVVLNGLDLNLAQVERGMA